MTAPRLTDAEIEYDVTALEVWGTTEMDSRRARAIRQLQADLAEANAKIAGFHALLAECEADNATKDGAK